MNNDRGGGKEMRREERRESNFSFNKHDLFPKSKTPRINIDDQIKETIHMSYSLGAIYHS